MTGGADPTRALFLVNPAAGGAPSADELEPIFARLRAGGFALRFVELTSDGPGAEELAADAVRNGEGAVIVAGGDGTVGGAARAVTGTAATLGVLPAGTHMNIARAIGLPCDDLPAAADRIARKRTRTVDVGRVAGRFFFEAAGVGLDADAFHAGHALVRRDRALVLAALGALVTRRGAVLEIDVDGARRRHRCLQAVVSNGPFYGWGFAVAPDARMDDGQLDLTLFADDRLRVAREFVAAMLGRDRPPRGRRYLGASITMRSREQVRVHADGVPVGELPQTFEVLPGALRVFA
ncbi:MAG: diacylglycerol kinase family protein [Candidatus Limnocylindria bacterium]